MSLWRRAGVVVLGLVVVGCPNGASSSEVLPAPSDDVAASEAPTTSTATTVPTTPTTTTEPTATTEAPIVLPDVEAPPGYELVWRDEFLEPTIDPRNWRIENSTFGDGNNSLHCYTPANADVRDGLLVLTGRAQTTTCPNGDTRRYSSGMVTSEDLARFTQGWFEVRARVPEGRGLWPAIWMSPNDDVYGRWPNSGEIDLMEVRGDDPDVARVNIHYLGSDNVRDQNPRDIRAVSGQGFADEFHTFGLLWEPGRMVFFIDGLQHHVIEGWSSAVGGGDAPFDQPFFFRLNLAIGGDYPGSPDASTPWPAEFEIDWVRVFQPAN